MEKQRGNPSHQEEEEEEDSEDSDNPEAETWYYKGKESTGEPVAQISEAWEQPLAHGASSSVDEESQKDIKKRHGDTTSKYRHTHPRKWKPSCPWSGKSVEGNLVIL